MEREGESVRNGESEREKVTENRKPEKERERQQEKERDEAPGQIQVQNRDLACESVTLFINHSSPKQTFLFCPD